jgi:signal transduction histidine kinase
MATQGGLSRYDPESDGFRTYDRASGLPVEHVMTIFEDHHGTLWLGLQGGGLARFERRAETFTTFGTGEGLPGGIVYCILGDELGLLWLSTSDGLSRFDPHSGTIVNYDESDGVLAEPFSKNACLQSRSGELFFGGGKGFMSFFPEAVQPDPEQPPIVLTDFQVFNRPAAIGGPGAPLQRHVTEAERIRLRHDQSVISIGYAALSYRAPHRNEYAYKLEGFDKDWNHVGGKRSATYTNLDPGRYVFRVKGSNSSGLWNDEGASIEIVVEPPLWRAWWAYGLYLLTASAIVLAFVGAHRRLRRLVAARTVELEERGRLLEERQRLIGALEARNDELRRFNYTLSHDLKSPLVTIKMFLGLARRDASAGDGERLRHDFGRIELAADTMYRQLEELYEFTRLDRVTQPSREVCLAALVREILDDLAETLDERGVEVVVDPALPAVRGDGTRLLEMLRELVDNAMEHFGDQAAPRIEIGVRNSDETPAFYVRDNGVGIDPRYHDRVFNLFERLQPESSRGTGIGLAMVRRIVELHGGRVWVESEGEGRGATFCFTLPGTPETASVAG